MEPQPSISDRLSPLLPEGLEPQKLQAVAAVQAQGQARGLGPRALLGLLNVCGFDAGRAVRLLENPYVRIRGLDEVSPVAATPPTPPTPESPTTPEVKVPAGPPPKLDIPDPRHRG